MSLDNDLGQEDDVLCSAWVFPLADTAHENMALFSK